MAETLQEKFIESKGQPVLVGDRQVIQMDLIPIRSGQVTVRFLSEPIGIHGVVLKSYEGSVTLSNGSNVPSVFLWNEPGLDREVTHTCGMSRWRARHLECLSHDSSNR